MDITFPQGTITGYLISGVLAILMTVVFVIVWKVKTKAKIFPMVIGAVIFVLFAEILKLIPVYPLVMADNAVSRAINSSPVLYYFTAALLAGIFEETGRLVAFRFVLKKYTERRTALDYGVGHGGIEALITSMTPISIASIGTAINSGMLDQILSAYPENQQAKMMEQITEFASHSFGTAMLWIPERAAAIMIHLALSIIVFRAVRDKKPLLYFIAVLLHFAVDFGLVFSAEHFVATEIALFAASLIMLITAIRCVYRRMPEDAEVLA